jgi:hypothetical protein
MQAAHIEHESTASAPPEASLPLFHSGAQVSYQGQTCTVDHIVIDHYDILVHLKELNTTVNSDKVQVQPTRIILKRTELV